MVDCPPGTPEIQQVQIGSRTELHGSEITFLCRGARIFVRFENPKTKQLGPPVLAEIDTGADVTFVKSEFLLPVKPDLIGKPSVVGGGPADTGLQVQFYKVNVKLPSGRSVQVRAGALDGRSYDALLGRDFLASVIFHYETSKGLVTIE